MFFSNGRFSKLGHMLRSRNGITDAGILLSNQNGYIRNKIISLSLVGSDSFGSVSPNFRVLGELEKMFQIYLYSLPT